MLAKIGIILAIWVAGLLVAPAFTVLWGLCVLILIAIFGKRQTDDGSQ